MASVEVQARLPAKLKPRCKDQAQATDQASANRQRDIVQPGSGHPPQRSRKLSRAAQQIAPRKPNSSSLEENLIAFRRGNVVIKQRQTLAHRSKVAISGGEARRKPWIEELLRQANVAAFDRVLPGTAPDRQDAARSPVAIIAKTGRPDQHGGAWVCEHPLRRQRALRGRSASAGLSRSAPENRQVLRAGEVMATTESRGGGALANQGAQPAQPLLRASFRQSTAPGILVRWVQFV